MLVISFTFWTPYPRKDKARYSLNRDLRVSRIQLRHVREGKHFLTLPVISFIINAICCSTTNATRRPHFIKKISEQHQKSRRHKGGMIQDTY